MSVNEEDIIRNDNAGSNYQSVISASMFKKFALARINAALHLMSTNNPNDKITKLRDNLDFIFQESRFTNFKLAFEKNKIESENLKSRLASGSITRSEYQYLSEEAESRYLDSFNEVYNSHIKDLQSIMTVLAHEVAPNGKIASVIKKINRQADSLRAMEKRPILENTYQVDNFQVTSRLSPEGELTTEQKEQYKNTFNQELKEDRIHTSPSTVRDIRQIGQANALRTEIKINDELMFTGHRHGSPSVLKINDSALRQHRTIENIKQTMAIAAKEKLEKLISEGKSRSDPLILDISSMSLLSPVMEGDLLDSMKQFRQVEDTRHAYWSLQGRDIEISVKLNGQEENIKVQLDSTFMSMGVNAVRGVGTRAAQKLVERVNNRGMDQFINKFLSHSQNDNQDPIRKKLNLIETNPKISKCKNSIADFNNLNKKKMNEAYELLDSLNKQLSRTDIEPTQKSEHEAKRDKALKSIQHFEKKLDKLYSNLARARKAVYVESIKELKEELETENKKDSRNQKKLNNSQLFIDTLDIYFNQPKPGILRIVKVKWYSNKKDKLLKTIAKNKNPEKDIQLKQKLENLQNKIDILNRTNYKIQSRFALLNANMGGFVEWFCKSGEDRTGLLNEHIEAFCIFTQKYGHPPRWGNDKDNQLFHDIMPHVHSGAPNRASNGFNDDSPGLKVSDRDFEIPTVSYAIDKKMANIGKKANSIHHSITLKNAEIAWAKLNEKSIAPLKANPAVESTQDNAKKVNSQRKESLPELKANPAAKQPSLLSFGAYSNHQKGKTKTEQEKTPLKTTNIVDVLSNDAVVDSSIAKDLKAKIAFVNSTVQKFKDIGLSLNERIQLSGIVSRERYLRLSRVNNKNSPDTVNIVPSQGFNQVYRNSEMYSLALIKGICEEIKFPLEKENLESFYSSVLDANKGDDSKSCKDALIALKQKFSKGSIPEEFINAILPFYDEFMKDIESMNNQNPELDPKAKSKANLEAQKEFLGQVCFQLIETPAMQLYPETPKEGAKLSMATRDLRKKLGVMDGILEALNEHRLTYVPPVLTPEALEKAGSVFNEDSKKKRQKSGM